MVGVRISEDIGLFGFEYVFYFSVWIYCNEIGYLSKD